MTAEVKNAPLLAGWAIAAGVGAVAAGVAYVVGELGANASVAAGAVLFVIVGVILGFPWGTEVRAAAVPESQLKPVAPPAETFAAAPAAFVSMPASARRPEALATPRGGMADELQLIEGIGPKLEQLCHSLGFFHFEQIANWTSDEIAWVDENLTGFKGRVTRDKWVAQARLILDVGRDEFLRRAKTNDY
jgi:predicted flap endonuclease-1-like 5' DNA nuclease